MKIEGSLTVAAPAPAVWSALLDPQLVGACIPGCSNVEAIDPDRFRGTIAMKFGPIEPRFEIEVAITDRVEGVSIASTTRGQEGSRASMLSSTNLLTLRELGAGTTEVAYESAVSVTGRLGKFGLGLMKKTAEKLAAEFGLALSTALQRHTSEGATDTRAQAGVPQARKAAGEPLSPAGQRYAERAMGLSAGIEGQDFAYGEHPAQRLTVFRSARPDGRVLLFWHGGGWTSGERAWMNFMAPAMTAAGVTFITAGYRLAPAHVFPAGFEDCADAVAWVRAHAQGLGADPGQLFVGGHSAGGHWAALLAVRQDWQQRRQLPADVIRGCLPISGVYLFGANSGLSARPRFLGPEPTEDPASPLWWLARADGPGRPAPFLLAWGERDFEHLRQQAGVFGAALEAAGTPIERCELPGRDHFEASLTAVDADGPWLERALAFMARPRPHQDLLRGDASAVASPAPVVLALRNVCFDYALPDGASLKVVDNATVQLRRGEVVAILGPSGCGKSTLLNIAAGLLPCQAGTVEVEGEDATGIPGKTGFMMQRDELLVWRTVLENVLLGPEVVNGRVAPGDSERALELLKIAGLAGFEHHYPGALSGGMRQRAAFVRTLMLDRPVALLDEPFGALDAITRSEMQEWLLQMRQQLDQTLLMITHDIDEAIFMSDRVLVMSSRPGRIALEIEIPFARPRRFEDIVVEPDYGQIKSRLLRAIHAPAASPGSEPLPSNSKVVQ